MEGRERTGGVKIKWGVRCITLSGWVIGQFTLKKWISYIYVGYKYVFIWFLGLNSGFSIFHNRYPVFDGSILSEVIIIVRECIVSEIFPENLVNPVHHIVSNYSLFVSVILPSPDNINYLLSVWYDNSISNIFLYL